MNALCHKFRAKPGLEVVDKDAVAEPLSSGDKAVDKQKVEELAAVISELQEILYAERRHKVLILLQGMDTSGKDGAVRGVFGKVDPLGIRSVSFKAPTADELAHDYLWRVHRHVPMLGEVVIFNRSHYEDVLVTRVHGLIDDEECQRRYAQIANFERMLTETGTTILKFFLHISRDEQKTRLQERLADPAKHWKFDPQDLKERAYWRDYQRLYAHAIHHTNADYAPWYVVPADSKTHRNLVIASIVHDVLRELRPAYPPGKPDYAKLQID